MISGIKLSIQLLDFRMNVMQFDLARKKAELQEKLRSLKFSLSEASLQLLPEYRQRIQVGTLQFAYKHFTFPGFFVLESMHRCT